MHLTWPPTRPGRGDRDRERVLAAGDRLPAVLGDLDADGAYLLLREFAPGPGRRPVPAPRRSDLTDLCDRVREVLGNSAVASGDTALWEKAGALSADLVGAVAAAHGSGSATRREQATERLARVFAPDGLDDRQRRHWQYLLVLGLTPATAEEQARSRQVPAALRPFTTMRERLRELARAGLDQHLRDVPAPVRLILAQMDEDAPLRPGGPVDLARNAARGWGEGGWPSPGPHNTLRPSRVVVGRLVTSAGSVDPRAEQLRRWYLPQPGLPAEQAKLWLVLRGQGMAPNPALEALAGVFSPPAGATGRRG